MITKLAEYNHLLRQSQLLKMSMLPEKDKLQLREPDSSAARHGKLLVVLNPLIMIHERILERVN